MIDILYLLASVARKFHLVIFSPLLLSLREKEIYSLSIYLSTTSLSIYSLSIYVFIAYLAMYFNMFFNHFHTALTSVWSPVNFLPSFFCFKRSAFTRTCFLSFSFCMSLFVNGWSLSLSLTPFDLSSVYEETNSSRRREKE
ncbi:hypothetical protein CSUI_007515 [Cystoisospora suis]|uniref:Transmembrane protein n=1 Tax=Cystoisospora suis TaxID=483139 RepID=A0A2C6JUI4_9APIC|nr:hypothetical protein CSUI_007515 [Cystoisospora suis]